MTVSGVSMETARLRPHHLLCERFLKLDFAERGVEFRNVDQKIRNLVRPDDPTVIEVAEGVDDLCRVCPHRRADRCEHPRGGEEAVRKWDGKILRGLGIAYGEARTSGQWHMLIKDKLPLDFCLARCPGKSNCRVIEASGDT